ncbi:uncharacterized protein LOC141858644 [Brevipalpus obovatus]|uniref:uncharacterized protein LOC141858644 n=1 Tax=Brevipalpus obovatus TaxID=246614 RepID=UPI003D9FA16B
MQQLVVFAALISCAFANYHAAPHVVPGPTVLTKNIHHVPAVAPVVNVQRTVQAVHHPPVTSVHHAPDTVFAKAPRIHGYAYASEVRHDAPVVSHAAPVIAHAAPVVAHAAPVVAHAAPVAAPILAHGYAGHGYAGHGIAAPVVGHGYAKAPIVNAGPIVQVGHAPVEHPAVSSYTINTGRTHVATQAHYGVAHKLAVVNVPGVKTIAETVKHVPVAVASHVVGHAPIAHGYGGHY